MTNQESDEIQAKAFGMIVFQSRLVSIGDYGRWVENKVKFLLQGERFRLSLEIKKLPLEEEALSRVLETLEGP